MTEDIDKSRLSETRRSIRSRVSRESVAQSGIPLDLTPVFEGGGRSFGKIGLGGAAVLGVAVVLWFAFRPTSEPPVPLGESVASLRVARGLVEMLPFGPTDQSRLMQLDFQTPIPAGSMLVTGKNSDRAAFRLASGASLRLDSNTRVEVSSGQAVVLKQGAVYLDAANSGQQLEVRTTLGIVRDIGTQFEVRLLEEEEPEDPPEQVLRVRVREGKVHLRHNQVNHEAVAGEELLWKAGGSLTRGTVPIHGPAWEWVMDTAPSPDLAGLDMKSFLDWFGREAGLEVSLEVENFQLNDPRNARPLTAKEALELALGAELEARFEGDRLVVAEKNGAI